MFNVKKWLTDDMGFSEAEAAEMAPKLEAEGRGDKIAASVGSLAANTAAAAELQKAQNDLKAASDALTVEITEWSRLTAAEKETATSQAAALEAARVRTVQLEGRLTNLAKQHGVDPTSLLEGTAVVPVVPAKPEPGAVDPRYASLDMFNSVAQFNLELAGALPYIQAEHFALTGKQLDTRTIVAEVKKRASIKGAVIDPVAIWEEQHGIANVRQQKAETARAAEITAAEARGREAARTEMAIPGPMAPGRHSIVFGKRDSAGVVNAPRTSSLARPQPGTTAMGAAAALRSGKYRPSGAR